MQTTFDLIDLFMEQISDELVFTVTCELIRAYEGKNLPVPIKKVYMSFSGEENKVTFFTDENGKKMEKNDITVKINCFVPLTTLPTAGHILLETVSLYIALKNQAVTGFTVGKTEYDSDVDAYKITCRINCSSTEEFKPMTA